LCSPPAWDETKSMIHHCKDIISALRSAGSRSSTIVLEYSGIMSGIVLSLLDGPKQVAIDCALYLSEVSGSFSVEELDVAVSACDIQEHSFVLAVLSRIRHSLRFCLSRAVSLLSLLHNLFKKNSDTRRSVFQSIRPYLDTKNTILPLSDEICSDISVALAIVSGDFHALVPGCFIQLSTCQGFLKAKSFDDVYVLQHDHDEYVVSMFPLTSICHARADWSLEEYFYLPVCKFCHQVMTLCNDFRNSTGIDLSLEFVTNNAIRTMCSLNPAACESAESHEINAQLHANFSCFLKIPVVFKIFPLPTWTILQYLILSKN